MAKTFSPQALRITLIIVLIAVMSGGAGLFYSGLKDVREFATEVNHTVADADKSGTLVKELQDLKNQLAQSQTLIAKANQMFATPANYQNQAITDINNYASASGLKIAKTSFEQLPTDIYPTMTVSLKTPVSYSKLIHFLDGIEGNMPKMQVTSIGISHAANGGADSVVVDDIKITIATR